MHRDHERFGQAIAERIRDRHGRVIASRGSVIVRRVQLETVSAGFGELANLYDAVVPVDERGVIGRFRFRERGVERGDHAAQFIA